MDPEVGELAVKHRAQKLVMKALKKHESDWKLCWFGCSCLWNISRSENTRMHFDKTVVDLLFHIMLAHDSKEQVVNTVIGTFSNLSLDYDFKMLLGQTNCLSIILTIARAHIHDSTVASTAAGLIANLAVSDEVAGKLMALEVMQVLSSMLYMNCNVQLLERNVASAMNNCITQPTFRNEFLRARLIEPFIGIRDKTVDESTIALVVNCLFVLGVTQNTITTTCHILAASGNIEDLKPMITEALPIDMLDSDGKTMLDLAAERHHLEVVEFLVKCGARINWISTPSHVQMKIRETLAEVKKAKFLKAESIQKCFATTVPQELCRRVIDFVPVFEIMVDMN